MKHKLSRVTLAVLGALMLVVLSGVPSPNAAQAQNLPSVAVELSSTSVTEGTAIAVTMSFGSLTFDDDRATKDYIFRADVAGADQCEEQAGGYGLGVDRYMWKVDEDPEVRRGTISADCPAGDYTVRARVSDANGGELASASASFSVAAPEPEPTPDPDSNDDPGSNQQDPDPPAPPIVLLAIPSEFTGGEEAQISMGFSGLEFDSDRSTIDYIFRADVKDSEDGDADECEVEAGGYGLGVDRYMYQVDEDPETRSGTISGDCPAGDYTLRASISSSGNQELASASAPFSVAAPTADTGEEEPPSSDEQQGSDGDQQDAPCGDQQAVFVLNSDRHRQPRITSAVYDATQEAVVLEWSAGSDIAGLTGFKIRRIAEGGMTEETYADLCDNPEGTDSRPSVGKTVRSYADAGVPATWQIIYNVYAIYGSKEVPSWSVAAKMTAAHGLVRARISSDGNELTYDIGWMDKGSLADGYKVYEKLDGLTNWVNLTFLDTDPAPQRFFFKARGALALGLRVDVRVRHGGIDADTGTLIGEVTTTVVAP